MTKTYAERKEVPVKNQTFDPSADPKNHAVPTDEKDFGIRGYEDAAAQSSEDPATKVSSRDLDRDGHK